MEWKDILVNIKYSDNNWWQNLDTSFVCAQTRCNAYIVHVKNIPYNNKFVEAALFLGEDNSEASEQIWNQIMSLICIDCGKNKPPNIMHPIITNDIKWYNNTKGYVYMLVEYIPFTLSKNQRNLTNNEKQTILTAASSALEYIHSKGCIHGDISPDNIGLRNIDEPIKFEDVVLIDFESCVLLNDFGYVSDYGISKMKYSALHRQINPMEPYYISDDYESLMYSIYCSNLNIHCKQQFLHSFVWPICFKV